MELPDDKALDVRFYTRSIVNQAKSYGEKGFDNDGKVVWEIVGAGRPVTEDVDYVLIHVPGDKDSIIDRPAKFCGNPADLATLTNAMGECRAPIQTQCDVHRFPRHWERYKAGKREQQVGTDLKEWPGVTRSQVEELAYRKVYTVEQLAALSDSSAAPFVREREKARAYLEAAKAQVSASEMKSALDERDAKLKEQDAKIAAMQAQMAEMLAAAQGNKKTQASKGA